MKYSGLKKHVRQKPNLKRHQCECCKKFFKNKLMKDFHKRIHHRQLCSKDFRVRVKVGSKFRKTDQLQKHWQSGKKIFDEFLIMFSLPI